MAKIMIVDDEAMTRNLVKRLLEPKGYEVVEAADGIDAFKNLTDDIDLIFLDWLMPNMSGIEFLEQFRKDKKNSNIKIVMLTALAEIENVVEAMDSGADDYIIKPFTSGLIFDKINELIL